MKCIILAAGYATRMYPLTLNTPKALLPYKDSVILDYVIKDIELPITLVSNHKFIDKFNEWNTNNINIIDNGIERVEDSIGVVGDLQLALQNINDDILVMAADNLLDFNINLFINAFNEHSMIMYHNEDDISKLQRTGVAEVENDIVIGFEEKPVIPKTHNAVPPFYVFNKEDMNKIKDYNGNKQCFGNLIECLYKQSIIEAFKMPGSRVDLGSIEQYKMAASVENFFTNEEDYNNSRKEEALV